MIDFSKEIKKMLIDNDMNQSQLAEALETSQGNLGNKLRRNDFRLSEMTKICELLGYNIEIRIYKKKPSEE